MILLHPVNPPHSPESVRRSLLSCPPNCFQTDWHPGYATAAATAAAASSAPTFQWRLSAATHRRPRRRPRIHPRFVRSFVAGTTMVNPFFSVSQSVSPTRALAGWTKISNCHLPLFVRRSLPPSLSAPKGEIARFLSPNRWRVEERAGERPIYLGDFHLRDHM